MFRFNVSSVCGPLPFEGGMAKVTRRVGTETPWSEVGMILLPTALPWTTDASRNIRNTRMKFVGVVLPNCD